MSDTLSKIRAARAEAAEAIAKLDAEYERDMKAAAQRRDTLKTAAQVNLLEELDRLLAEDEAVPAVEPIATKAPPEPAPKQDPTPPPATDEDRDPWPEGEPPAPAPSPVKTVTRRPTTRPSTTTTTAPAVQNGTTAGGLF